MFSLRIFVNTYVLKATKSFLGFKFKLLLQTFYFVNFELQRTPRCSADYRSTSIYKIFNVGKCLITGKRYI